MSLFDRDTDADWRLLGDTQPYFGVVSLPEFVGATLPAEALRTLYEAGEYDVAYITSVIERHTGAPLNPARALDFGCGVGRMTGAMAGLAAEATGYDVSPAMLEAARAQVGARARFVEALPDGPFDWINSFMVFQHIPTQRGMILLDQLLDRLAPGGVTSLHFTIGRADRLKTAGPFGLKPARYDGSLLHRLQLRHAPKGSVLMFDYDLAEIYARFRAHGVALATLVPTNHVGHDGVHVIGRRGDSDGLRHMSDAS